MSTETNRDPLDDASWPLPEPWMDWALDGSHRSDMYYVVDTRGGSDSAWRHLGTEDIRGAMSDKYPALPEIIKQRNEAMHRRGAKAKD